MNLDYAINKNAEKYPNLTLRWSIVPILTDRPCAPGRRRRTPGYFRDQLPRKVYKTLKDDGTLYVVDNEVENTKFYDLFSNGEAAKEARTADDGHQYGFGCEASNLGELFYNKELFDELGISEPTNYEEFKASIQKLEVQARYQSHCLVQKNGQQQRFFHWHLSQRDSRRDWMQ